MTSFLDFGIIIHQDSGQTKSVCPQCSQSRHKSKSPCLSVNIDKGIWNCHHCEWKGSLKGGEEKVACIQKVALPKMALPERIINWFKERGISESVLTRNNIGWEKVYMPAVGEKIGAIAIPYLKNGCVVNIKYRDEKKNFCQIKGAEKIFYGHDDVSGDEAIIVEGEIDKFSLEEAGYINCLSVPDGAPAPGAKNYDSKFSYLESCEGLLSNLNKIIIAVDNDLPGHKLEEEIVRRLGPERCWRVTWPDGCKDANDVLIKHNEFSVIEAINNAKPVPIAGLYEVKDILTDIDELYQKGSAKGVSTGWLNLDKLYTVRPCELTIVTGIPSHGKSEFIDALTVNLAEEHGWRFAIFSPENYPLQLHFAKLATKFIRQPFYPGPMEKMNTTELEEAKQWVGEHFYFILPPDNELTVEAILLKAKAAILRYGVRGVVIDPWNEIDHSRPSGLSETEYISKVLSKVRRFARIYQVHVWLIAHPVKLQKDSNGLYPAPTLYEISGSAHWRNKADNGICVWRDMEDKTRATEIHVVKIRWREVGEPGIADLRYNVQTGRYFPL